MPTPKKVLKIVQARDTHCWHCGTDDTLVPHHRINRGMGGSKLLDTPDNLMMVCALWNFLMEANAEEANAARGWGHKLPVWEKPNSPVFDRSAFQWFVLMPDGTKVKVNDLPF